MSPSEYLYANSLVQAVRRGHISDDKEFSQIQKLKVLLVDPVNGL